MRPFGCHVTILNTLDHLGKFDGKSDEGFFVRYLLNNKAFRVYNIRTRKVEENLNIRFLDDKPCIVRNRPKWLFDIDVLTNSMNYVPVIAGTNSNDFDDNGVKKDSGIDAHEKSANSINDVNTVRSSINTASIDFDTGSLNINTVSQIVSTASPEATHVDFLGDKPKADISNINTRIHKDHSLDLVIDNVQSKPIRVAKALTNPAWVEAMQEELLQFKLQKGYTQEEGIDYDEVFAPVARIEAIRLFLAYASFMGFMVYQMDVKSAFLYERIKEETKSRIFISQDKYVTKVLRKFNLSNAKTANTLVDTEKPLVKDADGDDIDVHLYRSMIGSLMYLTTSRPDIMYAVCVCSIFQVTTKVSHLHAVKRIFRYLKGHSKFGRWYPRDSSFELVAYTDSDYARASLDRMSTTRGCQFLGRRLISWQCRKQTVVATSTTEAEYVAATSCYGQVLWIQNPMLDYGRHLKLEDSDGINTLPNTEIFEQLALMGTAFTKLIMKVKKLEKTVKSTKARRRAKIVVSNDVDAAEDTSKQGRKIDVIDKDLDISLVQNDVEVQGRHKQEIKFDTEDISTTETLVYIRRSASKDKAVRLQEQLDEEERQRIARVHEEASSFNVVEMEDIQAIIKADEELALRIQAEEKEKYSEA
nr:uncharacterized mitochondrial protein AtMg00810-like [Tanacetum cinerariifolium]